VGNILILPGPIKIMDFLIWSRYYWKILAHNVLFFNVLFNAVQCVGFSGDR
jgi:hypothetical protein